MRRKPRKTLFSKPYLQRGSALIVLLPGADKSSQAKNIAEALLLAVDLTEET